MKHYRCADFTYDLRDFACQASLLLPLMMHVFYWADWFFPLEYAALCQWINEMQKRLVVLLHDALMARDIRAALRVDDEALSIRGAYYSMYSNLNRRVVRLQRCWERGAIIDEDREEVEEELLYLRILSDGLQEFLSNFPRY